MNVGIVGVGKMGSGIVKRLQTHGHTVHVYDINPAHEAGIVALGARFYASLEELVAELPTPRVIWVMVPASAVHGVIDELGRRLDSLDTVIDGGNTFYKDSQAAAAKLEKRGVHFIDIGVSGGTAGVEQGYALMIGGQSEQVAMIADITAALAGPGAAYHVGPAGAGHFVKMVHNAIEYGMMQSIGEGFALLRQGPYPDLPLARIAQLWCTGTIIRSYLLDLTAQALKQDEALSTTAAFVEDSGEGRWSTVAAVEHAVPFGTITAALYARFASRQPDSYAAKIVAALRHEFGGHAVKASNPPRL